MEAAAVTAGRYTYSQTVQLAVHVLAAVTMDTTCTTTAIAVF